MNVQDLIDAEIDVNCDNDLAHVVDHEEYKVTVPVTLTPRGWMLLIGILSTIDDKTAVIHVDVVQPALAAIVAADKQTS